MKRRSPPTPAPGSVRIIGGTWRGRMQPVVSAQGLRPTGQRIRETLFNWLGHHVIQAQCLDLFAGTGALGIEALSRGAAQCHFIEAQHAVMAQLRANLTRLQALDHSHLHALDALQFLRTQPVEPMNLIFLDPPFEQSLWSETVEVLHSRSWLASQGWIYVEYPAKQPPKLPNLWRLHRQQQAGQVGYQLFHYDQKGNTFSI